MPADRLTVRFAYQRGFQVVDGSTILQTFEKQAEAFKFVHGRGARVWLAWARTIIGGQTAPFDFAATFQQDKVGRIMRTMHGPTAGTWFWTVHTGGARGTVDSKDEAVAGVEAAFTRYIAEADKFKRRQ
ncbi:hypothetical protein LHFGNBLO_001357 [Mesorhizobium sp. AR10]|uniref:hypothetical protein n=1 Tax=Mesorhizobium sp. AR10 TaxID=2865839 RepID=UPI00215E144C|nr:hypothetical protein [Mesorhizobium sp. AR10]UVK39942.1 hypothetical protein LHFGNBLO_001357 [Mesorhizobium sp. AR10]